MKIVRLDRTDGFLFGLAFKGQQKQSVVIAPGLDRMILVLAGAHELILKADGTGSLQIVQTSDPLTLYVLCLVEAFTALLIDWKTCTEDDWACQGLLIVQMITDMLNCPETISQ